MLAATVQYFPFTVVTPKSIRARLKLTQDEFAGLLNISVNTLRNWEQARRKPEGPARVLLGIAATHPEVFAH